MYVIMIYSKNLYDTFVGNVSVDIPVDIALDIVSNGYYLDKRDMENILILAICFVLILLNIGIS